MDRAPFLFLGVLRGGVLADAKIAELFLKPAKAFEPLRRELTRRRRREHRAAGLGLMLAILVAAYLRELRDVFEAVVERAFVRPKLQLADARVVDQ